MSDSNGVADWTDLDVLHHNEIVKATTIFWNNAALAMISIGFATPTLATLYGFATAPDFDQPWPWAVAATCLIAGLALHRMAVGNLKELLL